MAEEEEVTMTEQDVLTTEEEIIACGLLRVVAQWLSGWVGLFNESAVRKVSGSTSEVLPPEARLLCSRSSFFLVAFPLLYGR